MKHLFSKFLVSFLLRALYYSAGLSIFQFFPCLIPPVFQEPKAVIQRAKNNLSIYLVVQWLQRSPIGKEMGGHQSATNVHTSLRSGASQLGCEAALYASTNNSSTFTIISSSAFIFSMSEYFLWIISYLHVKKRASATIAE